MGCNNLKKVYAPSETPANIGPETFNNCDKLEGIYVLSSSIEAYKTNWSEYKDIIKGIYKVTVENGSGGGNFVEGKTVNIKANDNNEKGHFTSWKVTSGSGVTLADEKAKETTFTMPGSDVTIEAVFEAHNYVDGKCSVCGYEDKNYVPSKDDNKENIGNNDKNNNNSVSSNSQVNTNNTSQNGIVKTGDNNNLIIWCLVVGVCVLSIGSLIVYKKRTNK